MKIDRVAVGRKPVRKLPAVPNSKQAHIVQLKTEPKKSSRALPKPPNNDENSSPVAKKGLRLTNFFRSVKFPKNKKIQPAPVRIFGRDLSELAKATNLEGKFQFVRAIDWTIRTNLENSETIRQHCTIQTTVDNLDNSDNSNNLGKFGQPWTI